MKYVFLLPERTVLIIFSFCIELQIAVLDRNLISRWKFWTWLRLVVKEWGCNGYAKNTAPVYFCLVKLNRNCVQTNEKRNQYTV